MANGEGIPPYAIVLRKGRGEWIAYWYDENAVRHECRATYRPEAREAALAAIGHEVGLVRPGQRAHDADEDGLDVRGGAESWA